MENNGAKRERYIAQAMAATADIEAFVWSDAVLDGMGLMDRFELLKQLRDMGVQLEATVFGYRVCRLRQSQADTVKLVALVRKGIKVRMGEVITDEVALERANNIVMGLTGEFDFTRRVMS